MMSSLSYFHETVLFAVARSFTITVDKYDLTINVLCVCVWFCICTHAFRIDQCINALIIPAHPSRAFPVFGEVLSLDK